MDLEPEGIQKLAWDIFHLTNKLRFMGYDLTTDKARNKGEYTICDIASRGDHKALRVNTDEFDDVAYHNALFHVEAVKDAIKQLSDSMESWKTQLVKASGHEPPTLTP